MKLPGAGLQRQARGTQRRRRTRGSPVVNAKYRTEARRRLQEAVFPTDVANVNAVDLRLVFTLHALRCMHIRARKEPSQYHASLHQASTPSLCPYALFMPFALLGPICAGTTPSSFTEVMKDLLTHLHPLVHLVKISINASSGLHPHVRKRFVTRCSRDLGTFRSTTAQYVSCAQLSYPHDTKNTLFPLVPTERRQEAHSSP